MKTTHRKAPLGALFFTFLKIGAFTFGGGYAMLALLEDECVRKRGWLTREEFLDMAAVAESTPGPVAINGATYIGYQVGGFGGASLATLGVCIPSFLIIYLISLFFDKFLSLPLVNSAFQGIRVCVVYLVLSAGVRLWKGLEKTTFPRLIVLGVLMLMTATSLLVASFSSVYCILLCGLLGLGAYGIRKMKNRIDHKTGETDNINKKGGGTHAS